MKKRILSFLLALLMLVGMVPVSVVAEGKSEYEKNETGTAVFNSALLGQIAYISNDPTLGLQMSGDYTITVDEALLSQTFSIADSYADDCGYWYKLAPIGEEEMPQKISAMPWVYQNDIPTGDYADALIVTPPANTCRCCDDCSGTEDCECSCGACNFCQPEEPEYPSMTHPESGVVVTAESFPEGVTLSVKDANVTSQLKKYQIPESKKVFGLDISLVNTDSSVYQPGGALVKVPVSAPTGTSIGIIHDHNGDVSFMGVTVVLSDGTVEFYTDNFSTFAGFTVDFHYNGVDFSIDGMSEILLSDLFTAMGIEEDAYAAESVVFSDNTLVSVEQQEDGNWLLTSLQAFQTEETLIITFNDDRTIVIDVTDNIDYGYEDGVYHVTYSSTGMRFHFACGLGGGTYRVRLRVYDGDTEVYTERSDNKVITSATFWVNGGDSNNYWYEVRGSQYMGNVAYTWLDGGNKRVIGTGAYNILSKNEKELWLNRYSREIFGSKNSYCTVWQAPELVLNDDIVLRNVVLYVDGKEVDKKENVQFPDRDDDGPLAEDLDKITPRSGYYKRGDVGGGATVVVSGNTYNVYLVTSGTVAYNANGGAGAPASQTKYYGVNLTLQSGQPTKSYSTFKGWATTKERADAGTVDYKAGATYTGNLTPGSTTTLYAVWDYADANYTVKHLKQNLTGTGYDEVTADRQTIKSKAYASVTPAVKSYPGFSSPSAKTITVNGDGSTVVEYKYDRLSYTINYFPGNGSGTMASQTFKYGANATIKSSTFTAPKGQKFLGWTTNTSYADDGHGWTGWSGTWSYVDGQYGVSNRALNLYARWGKKTYTVNYYSNGGSGSMDSHTVVYGNTIQIKNNAFTAPTGKRFAGWAISATGTAGEHGWSKTDKTGWSGAWTFDNGEKGIANDTLNLYAIWEDAEYTVTWKNWNGEVLETDTVTYNGSAAFDKSQPTRPDADGYSYSFTGWDKDTSKVTDDMEVTAQYGKTPISYTATFNYNGGDAGVASQTFHVTSALTLPKLTRLGYAGRWKVTEAAGNWTNGAEFASEGSVAAGMYGNVTFTAQWDDQYRYVLNFDSNTTDTVGNMPANVDTGWTDITKYTALLHTIPTRANYDFLGWATSSNAAAADVLTSFELQGIAHDTASDTLYAVWQRHTGDLKLTFNGGETNPAIVTVTGQGKTITLVLTKAETVIKNLPTGEYTVTVEAGNASYTASVKTNPTPQIEKGQTAAAEIEIGSRGLNWFTAFFRVKNKHS